MTWNADDANTVRQMIAKETEFINNRITWLVTLQGFLFAALGFAWKDGRELINVLGAIGIVASLSLALPIHLAHQGILNMKKAWDKNKPDNYDGPDVIGYYSPNPLVRLILSWLAPWHSLPILFVVAWVVVIWVQSG